MNFCQFQKVLKKSFLYLLDLKLWIIFFNCILNSVYFSFLSFFFFEKVEAITLESGEKIFQMNCSVCHTGGNNIIIPEKNLKKETLEANGMNNIKAISYQVLNGKNGMPAFGGRLKEQEIEEVALYVLQQSGKNFMDY